MNRALRAYVVSSGSAHQVRDTINAALDAEGFRVVDPQRSLAAGSQWTELLGDELRRADLVVADLDESEWGRYELGLAHGMRKPTILLIDQDLHDRIPPQLTGLSAIVYRSSDLGHLRTEVKRAARRFIERERSTP